MSHHFFSVQSQDPDADGGYGIVGTLEYVLGWGILFSLSQSYHLPLFISFTAQFVLVGYLVGFLLRKYWVFKA